MVRQGERNYQIRVAGYNVVDHTYTFGGGVLIQPNWVLTAASVVTRKDSNPVELLNPLDLHAGSVDLLDAVHLQHRIILTDVGNRVFVRNLWDWHNHKGYSKCL